MVVCINVIKNMTTQIMINLPQILIWPVRPYNNSLYQIWSYFDQSKQNYRSKNLKSFLLRNMGKWVYARQHGCHNINVWRFSKFWTAVIRKFIGVSTWNLQRPFKMRLFTLCKNFVWKIVDLIFWWHHCKPRIDKFHRWRVSQNV